MSNIRPSVKNISRYLDISFLINFVVVLTVFYYFNLLYWGITDPKNFYLPFLDHHLNYISWLNTSILTLARSIDQLFNIHAIITGNKIYVPKGASILLSYECLGFGITGFWIAFIVAHKNHWKKKLVWCLSGVVTIWFINCWRIAILMLALQHKWEVNKYIDHHDIFNIVSYILILSLMYYFTRVNSQAVSYDLAFSKSERGAMAVNHKQA